MGNELLGLQHVLLDDGPPQRRDGCLPQVNLSSTARAGDANECTIAIQ
jgi:hypothetical protein